MQAIEQILLKKRRNRDAAAFHENPGTAALVQQSLQLGDVDAGGAVLDGDDPCPAEMAFARAGQRSRPR